LTPVGREAAIARIASLPDRLERVAGSLTPGQLDTPYRPGGWTVRQVIHHLPDSHINGYIRCKLTLAEDRPAIRPYDESRWAILNDTRDTPPEVSLRLLRALHDRWVTLFRGMTDRDLDRDMFHPENGRWI